MPAAPSTPISLHALRLGPPRHDMSGRSLGRELREDRDARPIHPGLARRLVGHARKRIARTGIALRPEWAIEVMTPHAERRPSDRSYCVRFRTHTGSEIGIQEILISRYGWPRIDGGIFLEE